MELIEGKKVLPGRYAPGELKVNDRYWAVYKHPTTNFFQVIDTVFTNSIVDNKRLREGRACMTVADADKVLHTL